MTLAMPKAALLYPPLLAVESSYEGVRSSALGEFVIQAAAALVLLMLVWSVIDKLRGGTPQKREVSFADEMVTQEELKQAHGRISREREDINREILNLKQEQKEQRDALAGTIKEFNDRIDKVPQRTITLLRETKNLI